MDKRRRWFATVLEEGLRLGVLSPEGVLQHVTPAVLATDLPPNLVASLIQAGIAGSAFDASVVVQTLGPEKLAEHVPLPLLWSVFDEAAGRMIEAHPLPSNVKPDVQAETEVAEPGEVRPEDVPVIEVLEE